MGFFQITASIVLYKQAMDAVKQTIESFLATKLKVQLFLVANSPLPELDGFADDPRVHIIHAYDNPGFGKGHNLAIRKAGDSQYYLVLNPDTSFEPGVLETLFDYMEANPDVGNVMPKVLYPDGSLQRLCKLLPTPLNVWSRRFMPAPGWAQKLNRKYELHDFDYNSIMPIPNLSGCFMFIRNDVLRKTGGFDERFFLYLEDIDLNRRIAQHAKTVFYPYVSLTHHYTRGSYNNRKLLRHHIVSAIKYFNKWGWIFDKERRKINRETLGLLKKSDQTLEVNKRKKL
ncbi:MAG: glycosyltransferase family 2 protein [Niabella sp.]